VLQRQIVGVPLHAAGVILNPVLVATAALAAAPTARAAVSFGCMCAARMVLDAACGSAMRPRGFAWTQLALTPVKDLVFAAAWSYGLVSEHVVWRGKRIRVLEGTRIAVPLDAPPDRARAAGAA
jgi:hypothetical protein